MKTIKTFVTALVLTSSFGAFASQTITASGATLDATEAKIAAQAQEMGASYKITSAFNRNQVHMTAELTK